MARKKVTKEEVIEKISLMKKAYNTAKAWLIANGVEGVAGLIAGLLLWVFGYKIWAGFSFGVFATRNWDIFKAWVQSLVKK